MILVVNGTFVSLGWRYYEKQNKERRVFPMGLSTGVKIMDSTRVEVRE